MSLTRCPTCDNTKEEIAPGIREWMPSEYQLNGESHACNCPTQIRLMELYLLAGIPSLYWTLGWDDFFGDQQAKSDAQDYLDKWSNLQRQGIGISFYSPIQGTGKTMLSVLIAKDLIKQGERVMFTHFAETLRAYQMPWDERKEFEQRIRNTPLVVLDEVRKAITDAQGAVFANSLEDLIRFRASGNAVTITTTNLTLDELDEQYARAFSLLAEKQTFVHVNGPDVRRNGDVNKTNLELVMNNERKPIV